MENTQFKIACALRLGARICQPHVCTCGKEVKSDGLHGLSCQKAAGRHPRHSHINDLIKRALLSGGISSVREPLGVSRCDGKRPDGMTIFPWKQGRPLLWDFTCGDTLAPSSINQSAKEPGKVASNAETRKINHYQNLTNDYIFVPISVETLGVWGDLGMDFIKEVGRKIKDETGEKRSTSFLFQSISIAVQRGNALSVLGTVQEDSTGLDEIFLL